MNAEVESLGSDGLYLLGWRVSALQKLVYSAQLNGEVGLLQRAEQGGGLATCTRGVSVGGAAPGHTSEKRAKRGVFYTHCGHPCMDWKGTLCHFSESRGRLGKTSAFPMDLRGPRHGHANGK